MLDRDFKRIYSYKYRRIGGVCAGMAYCFGIRTWIMRIMWIVATILCTPDLEIGVIAYTVFFIFSPVWEETPEDYVKICE
ncbi:PspC domain-containing protein [Candidatus Falkowbacteria bacterium]|uniref:Phage shock protein PspC N-terminal domain-containing protein n=1 Tax=Candidatus Buchananbacteria bacterium CG10_big_fil_rev_8_21_14_0_10_33_19 TaxID=1974525 RepID=A0A2H0W3P8_9BACT|nr:PspC domain-containing protein [Candidatus Falkowbacteria bacterium]PIS05988.1 MAG: hypothetical protein COT80_04445 [Candidatus Buchananbacteria bacterium CG10_big_fil_rev_8_21_14_0_10_33_19]